MAGWKTIDLYDSQIKLMTEKSALIRTPNGWKFWHPAKLIRPGRGAMTQMSYTDDFTFRLFKDAKGANGYHKTAEKEVGAEEIEDEFERQRLAGESRITVETPEYLAPEDNEVADDLRI